MKKLVIVGNWKMNKNIDEAVAFCEGFKEFSNVAKKNNVYVGVASTPLCLSNIVKYSKDMIISAETCHYEDKGAFTGEVSAKMLSDLGVNYCIIGHSERRKYDNETSEKCNLKIKKLLSLNMTPIYCVGETLEEYESNNSKKVVEQQISIGLKDLEEKDFNNFVIAYEPVWSIGTGKSASLEIAEDMCKYIRSLVEKYISLNASKNVIIQYGGSVKTTNAYEYLHSPNIDGVLVGGASLEVESFIELARKGLE